MSSFGTSEANVLEEHDDSTYHTDDHDGVRVFHSRIDPFIIADGVDRFEVGEESEDRYLVIYSGYATGHLRVTREGIAEFGDLCLTERGDPPSWFVAPESVDETDLPWWVPDSIDLYPESECDRCGEMTLSRLIVTPFAHDDEMPDEQFCQECWEEIRDEYEQDLFRR